MTTEYIIRKGDTVRRENCLAEIAGLDDGKAWRVSIKPYRKQRTLNQNSMLWAWYALVVDAIEADTGTDKDELHEFFKAKFCKPKAIELAGEWREMRSTKVLNTAEMSEYMERIYAFCVERIGLALPTPGMWVECKGDVALVQERLRDNRDPALRTSEG